MVEYLGGVDDLAGHLRDFRPGPERRVGVLVDHLVAGSKESRIARASEVAGRQARAHRRPPVRRHLGGGQAGAVGLAVARRAAQHRVEEGRLPAARLAAPRPGRHRPRVAAHPGPGRRPTATSTRPCWAGSRSSSTSSPAGTEPAARPPAAVAPFASLVSVDEDQDAVDERPTSAADAAGQDRHGRSCQTAVLVSPM